MVKNDASNAYLKSTEKSKILELPPEQKTFASPLVAIVELGSNHDDSVRTASEKTFTIHAFFATTLITVLSVMGWSTTAAIAVFVVLFLIASILSIVFYAVKKDHTFPRLFILCSSFFYIFIIFFSEGCQPIRRSSGKIFVLLLPHFLFHVPMGGTLFVQIIAAAVFLGYYVVVSIVESAIRDECFKIDPPKVINEHGLVFVQCVLPIAFIFSAALYIFHTARKNEEQTWVAEDIAKNVLRALVKQDYAQLREAVAPLDDPNHVPTFSDDALVIAVEHIESLREMVPVHIMAEADPTAPPSSGTHPESNSKFNPVITFLTPSQEAISQGGSSDDDAGKSPGQKHGSKTNSPNLTPRDDKDGAKESPQEEGFAVARNRRKSRVIQIDVETASNGGGPPTGALRRRSSLRDFPKAHLTSEKPFLVVFALPCVGNYTSRANFSSELLELVLSEFVDNVHTVLSKYQGTILWGHGTRVYCKFPHLTQACAASLAFLAAMKSEANHHRDPILNETRAHFPFVTVLHAIVHAGPMGTKPSQMMILGEARAEDVVNRLIKRFALTVLSPPVAVIASSFKHLAEEAFVLAPGPHESISILESAKQYDEDGLPSAPELNQEVNFDKTIFELPDFEDLPGEVGHAILEQGRHDHHHHHHQQHASNEHGTHVTLTGSAIEMVRQGKKKLPAEVMEMWNRFDADRSGTLDVDEIKEVLASMGIEMEGEELKKFFDDVDQDRSGSVSLDEFQRSFFSSTLGGSQVMSEIRRAAVAMARNTGTDNIPIVLNAWKKYDKDGSGSLEPKELALVLADLSMPHTDEEVVWLVDHLDANGNGMIDFEEFVALFSEDDAATKKLNVVKERIQIVSRVMNSTSDTLYTTKSQTDRDDKMRNAQLLYDYYYLPIYMYILYAACQAMWSSAIGGIESPSSTFIAVNLVIDLIYIAWYVMKLTILPREMKGQILFKNKDVLLDYCTSVEFVVDTIVVIPADFIYIGLGSYGGGVIGYFRLNKVLALYHLDDKFEQLCERFLNPVFIRAAAAIMWFLVIAHMATCCGVVLAKNVGDPILKDMMGTDRLIATHHTTYLKAYYWAVLTMAGQLRGDAVPTTDEELWLYLVCVLIGLPIYTVILATVGNVVSVEDSDSKYLGKIDELRNWFEYNEIPDEFQGQVISYYQHLYGTTGTLDISENPLEDLPIELLVQVTIEVGREMLRKVPIFQSAAENLEFVHELTHKLVPMVIEPGVIVMKKGERGTNMYFVTFGDFHVVIDGIGRVAKISAGPTGFFGEIALLHNVKRTATIECGSRYSNVLMLDKRDFDEVSATFPQCLSQVYKAAEGRLKQMLEKEAEEARKAKEAKQKEKEKRKAEPSVEKKDDVNNNEDDDDDEEAEESTERILAKAKAPSLSQQNFAAALIQRHMAQSVEMIRHQSMKKQDTVTSKPEEKSPKKEDVQKFHSEDVNTARSDESGEKTEDETDAAPTSLKSPSKVSQADVSIQDRAQSQESSENLPGTVIDSEPRSLLHVSSQPRPSTSNCALRPLDGSSPVEKPTSAAFNQSPSVQPPTDFQPGADPKTAKEEEDMEDNEELPEALRTLDDSSDSD